MKEHRDIWSTAIRQHVDPSQYNVPEFLNYDSQAVDRYLKSYDDDSAGKAVEKIAPLPNELEGND
jgi:N-acetylmuramoyl-L-alanine amidase CwlA